MKTFLKIILGLAAIGLWLYGCFNPIVDEPRVMCATGIWVGIATAVIAAGGAVYTGSQQKKAAKAAGARADKSGDVLSGLADEYLRTGQIDLSNLSEEQKEIFAQMQANVMKYIAPLEFTPSRGPLDKDDAGNTMYSEMFALQGSLKRGNLDFILGASQPALRKAQTRFTALASGDTKDFTKELRASAFGALAETRGDPTGSFSNVSAKNLMDFRTKGLSAALDIDDFFAKQGTVDPSAALRDTLSVAEFGQREAGRKDEFGLTKGQAMVSGLNAALGMEAQFNQNAFTAGRALEEFRIKTIGTGLGFYQDAAGAGALGAAQQGAGYAQAAALAGQALQQYRQSQEREKYLGMLQGSTTASASAATSADTNARLAAYYYPTTYSAA